MNNVLKELLLAVAYRVLGRDYVDSVIEADKNAKKTDEKKEDSDNGD